MSGTTKLKLYNGALLKLGNRTLAFLTETREVRRLLDSAWDNGIVNECLEEGEWSWALCTSHFEYDPGITPDFGYRYAFAKPDDFVKLAAISTDEYLNFPFNAYKDGNGYWSTDVTDLYIEFVSNGATYGGDLSLWPESFSEFVEYSLALEICGPTTNSESKKESLGKDKKKALLNARSNDGLGKATRSLPSGRWTSSRGNSRGNGGRGDGGGRGGLIG